MRLPPQLVEFFAARLGVPRSAVRMFRAANRLSGLDKATLPTELIPLNTIQLSRGLLNFAVFQSSLDWVLPFWATRQYDHRSPSFIPRSHMGLSMNVTHRSWTAVGNPDCPIEPIVDPRGLVTPFKDGWSLDIWLEEDGECLFPSRRGEAIQRLIGGMPLVATDFSWRGWTVSLQTYTYGQALYHSVALRHTSHAARRCRVAVAVRPFNPEGVGPVPDLRFDSAHRLFLVGEHGRVWFPAMPDEIRCSDFDNGDSAAAFAAGASGVIEQAACDVGLANGYAAFHVHVPPDETVTIPVSIPLQTGTDAAPPEHPPALALEAWKTLLSAGTVLESPDPALNTLFQASVATLLMLVDGDTITPGPATYHHFWFRDAAYMLSALDRVGYGERMEPLLRGWPSRQERSGYFRSQQGEWDANGQVLWTVWHHLQYAPSPALLNDVLPSLRRAVQWIENTRRFSVDGQDTVADGLLPAGLSAEHLGLVDKYFWDNFWSLAGLEAFGRFCRAMGMVEDHENARASCSAYRNDIEHAIAVAGERTASEAIPAGPTRGHDHGMIGSCCAWYPLQLFPPDDRRMLRTLQILDARFGHEGLFFQEFIHSGINIYLSLHVAHGWLYAGMRGRFWEIVQRVLQKASSTFAFPEAVHPMTGGGVMGDGHHGWAAAEVVAALCDACVYPRWEANSDTPALILLGGVPPAWFAPGTTWAIRSLRVPGGSITVECSTTGASTRVALSYASRTPVAEGRWIIRFPFAVTTAEVDGTPCPLPPQGGDETSLEIAARARTILVVGRRHS